MEAAFSLQISNSTFTNTFTNKDILSKNWTTGKASSGVALPAYAIPILRFCYDWLSGQQEFIVHSSGSTGVPKAITLSRQQMQASAWQTARALKLRAGDRALLCMNAAYIGGKMMLVRAMEHALILTATEVQADPLAGLPADSHFDFTALVPLQLSAILQNDHSRTILQKMKAIIVGGAPVGQQLRKQLLSINAPVYSTYGMTETVSHIALQRLNGAERSDYYQAFPEIKLSQDTRGCLCIEAGAITGGEKLLTNDLVELIDSHRFRWIGRADNIINSGGIKVQLEKIDQVAEGILLQLDIQRKLFAWALPDERLGQRLILLIEGRELAESTESVILKQFALQAGKYEQPQEIFYVENFKETSSGKIQKRETVALLPNT